MRFAVSGVVCASPVLPTQNLKLKPVLPTQNLKLKPVLPTQNLKLKPVLPWQNLKLNLVGLWLVYHASACLAAPLTAAQIAAVNTASQKQMQRVLASKQSAGVGFALIDEGKVVLMSANGVRNRSMGASKSNQFDLDTPMAVGGVTRLFTTLAALKLAQSGALDIRAPLKRYLPEVSFATHLPSAQIRPIVLHDMLLGSAGISQGRLRDAFVPVATPAQNILAAPIWLTRPAGHFAEPSYLSDALLTLAMERASKQPLASLLDDSIFAPLGLRATGLSGAGVPSATIFAAEHDDGKVLPARVAALPGALGLHTSVRDLAAVISALELGHAGVPEGVRSALFAPENADFDYDFSVPGTGQGYVFAFSESARASVGLVGYLGSNRLGHDVSIRLMPKHHLAVLVMSNASSDGEEVRDLLSTIVDTALAEKAGIPARDKKKPLREPPKTLSLPTGFISDAVQTSYATPAGLLVPDVDGDAFDFKLAGFGLRAYRRDDGWYGLRYRLLGVIPLSFSFIENILIAPVQHVNQAGVTEHLMLYAAGSDIGLFGSTITATDAREGTTDAATDWLGKYEIANPDVMSKASKVFDIRIVRENNVLLLRASIDQFINVDLAMPLTLAGNRAVLSGFGPGLGEAFTRRNDGVLDFGGYLLRRR
jgi:CubicO group peptidase (beta-lactamase class C family)